MGRHTAGSGRSRQLGNLAFTVEACLGVVSSGADPSVRGGNLPGSRNQAALRGDGVRRGEPGRDPSRAFSDPGRSARGAGAGGRYTSVPSRVRPGTRPSQALPDPHYGESGESRQRLDPRGGRTGLGLPGSERVRAAGERVWHVFSGRRRVGVGRYPSGSPDPNATPSEATESQESVPAGGAASRLSRDRALLSAGQSSTARHGRSDCTPASADLPRWRAHHPPDAENRGSEMDLRHTGHRAPAGTVSDPARTGASAPAYTRFLVRASAGAPDLGGTGGKVGSG